jgi:RimJ/RimL family protein N-acetyltransferase
VIALAFGLECIGQHRIGPELARRRPRPVLDRVVVVVDPDNARSLAVCRRLGMTHRGQTTAYYGETLELFELSRTAL